ncbi:RNA-binding S4 domain-containing protein [Xinfangfangia sp. CPCC 101601]|uniref:RNA-binding S4 domain-containing protein n=1 Tax=Pseudogemmobacter lacusdianii TaxID=3069608 RepID=A0ABU0VTD4_9RHOB|nr:RNA-binding S4 domain-containing protein [Xinfangfangia sp. CPCC 101601]MDQ2064979.1 RNA-binding S4 domain-containing protein [Xinfangfangia sp. CPCC 101601]
MTGAKPLPSPALRDSPGAMPAQAPRLRIDKWLWQARFFKTRGLAAELIESGHLRVNGQPIHRASREVGPGDTLTFPQGKNIRLIRITGTGVRRGPASEAMTLFIDLDPPAATPHRLD